MRIKRLDKDLKELRYNKEDYRSTCKFKVDNYTVITSCIHDEDGVDVAFAVFDKDVDEKQVNLDFIKKNAVAFFKLCAENYIVEHFIRDKKAYQKVLEKADELKIISTEIVSERERKFKKLLKEYKVIVAEYSSILAFKVAKELKRKLGARDVLIYSEVIKYLTENLEEILTNSNELVNYFTDELQARILNIINFILLKQEALEKAWISILLEKEFYNRPVLELEFCEKALTSEDFRKEKVVGNLLMSLLRASACGIYFSFDIDDKIKVSVYKNRSYKYRVSIKKKDKQIQLTTNNLYIADIISDYAKLVNADLDRFRINAIVIL